MPPYRFELEIEKRVSEWCKQKHTHTHIHKHLTRKTEKRMHTHRTTKTDRIVENDQSVDTYFVKNAYNHTHSNAPIRIKICYLSREAITDAQTARDCAKKREWSSNKYNTTEQFVDRYSSIHRIFLLYNKDDTIGPMCGRYEIENSHRKKNYVPPLCVPFVDPLFQLYWKLFAKATSQILRKRHI